MLWEEPFSRELRLKVLPYKVRVRISKLGKASQREQSLRLALKDI